MTPSAGTRRCRSRRELFIERDDFREDPPKKFFRLAPGREVRLRGAYFVTCTAVDQGRGGARSRASLHLRSGDARRRRAGRPQGEGDAALGLGGARAGRRGAALRSAVQQRIAGARPGDFLADLNPASLDVIARRQGRAERRRRRAGHAVSSSSASGISASIRTRHPAGSSSTVPSP